jgi:hypothetical protein
LEIRDEVGFFQEVRAVLAKSIGGEGGKKSPEELELAVRQIVSRAISSDNHPANFSTNPRFFPGLNPSRL